MLAGEAGICETGVSQVLEAYASERGALGSEACARIGGSAAVRGVVARRGRWLPGCARYTHAS